MRSKRNCGSEEVVSKKSNTGLMARQHEVRKIMDVDDEHSVHFSTFFTCPKASRASTSSPCACMSFKTDLQVHIIVSSFSVIEVKSSRVDSRQPAECGTFDISVRTRRRSSCETEGGLENTLVDTAMTGQL